MRHYLVLRQILMDDLTLGDYYAGKGVVKWEIIKWRMIYNERTVNPQIPDHFYHIAVENYLEKNEITSLRTLISKGFLLLAKGHLEIKDKIVYVQKNACMEWQDLLTFCPPLVLSAALVANELLSIKGNKIDVNEYVNLNAHCSALLSPNIPYLDNIRKNEGFDDLHIHLNAVTESEHIWLEALKNPYGLCRACEAGALNYQAYTEQDKLNYGLNDIYLFLTEARALRYYIIKKYLAKQVRAELEYPSYDFQIEKYDIFSGIEKHPIKEEVTDEHTDMESEMLFYIEVFTYLNKKDLSGKEDFVKAFYYYLLIHAYINRFLVQQVCQKGFLQFQKVAHFNMREQVTSDLSAVFSQLNGNQSSNFRILEVRFSLRNKVIDTVKYIDTINKEWTKYKTSPAIQPAPVQSLRLVVHLLKLYCEDKSLSRRGETLRKKVWEQSLMIQQVKNMINQRSKSIVAGRSNDIINIVGVDVAGSEFNASPEVFAPAYRFLRGEKVIEHFTYHVGEDFYHILSGLRHIYEAIDFLGLQKNDRLGHAVALGIKPELWYSRIGDYLCISQGEWLDDLIFVSYLKQKAGNGIELGFDESKVKAEIKKCAEEIYGKKYQVDELILAWKSRKWEPNLFLCKTLREAHSYDFDEKEWMSIHKEKKKLSTNVIELVRLYHNAECRKRYDSKCIYREECEETLGTGCIEKLQGVLLDYIVKLGIVIETLPTSNMRIGIYNSYEELHLKDWLIDHPELPIVLGSDDPGVFATNIYNEYAYIYNILERTKKSNECQDIIRKVHEDSLKFAFN